MIEVCNQQYKGSKTDEIGQSSCKPCAAGFYCENGSDELECPAGIA